MKEREFTYQDGIIEGRLIENGFFAIGKSMFVCRTVNSFYVVTNPEDGDSSLEMFQHLSEPKTTELEFSEYVQWLREDEFTHQALHIHGHIDDIIDVVKLAKSKYD